MRNMAASEVPVVDMDRFGPASVLALGADLSQGGVAASHPSWHVFANKKVLLSRATRALEPIYIGICVSHIVVLHMVYTKVAFVLNLL